MSAGLPWAVAVVRSTFVHVECAAGPRCQRRNASAPPHAVARDVPPELYALDGRVWRPAGPSVGATATVLAAPPSVPPAPLLHCHDHRGQSDVSTGASDAPPTSPAAAGDTRTTVMMRNLPGSMSRAGLVKLLTDEGFGGEFDFLYLPINFGTGANLGFAFVNLVSPRVARRFRAWFHRFSRWGSRTAKLCNVSWARDQQQGLAANVRRFQNSSVMHRSVPDEHRPLLLAGGAPSPFPRPTKRVPPPHEFAGAAGGRRAQ